MNETIIRRHNERVKPDDTVFFLGDSIFKGGKEGGVEKYRQSEKRLNGKFIFIKGNHDRNNSLRTIITKMYIHYGSREYLESFAKREGLEVFKVYQDDGISGYSTERPALKNLLKDAKEKKLELVL